MRLNDLRQKYLEFFQSRGHLYQPASPLVPIDVLGVEDKSTLFTSAGMQQYKPYFAGTAAPPSPRICTVQKCLRTGDIDSVGDYSHCTLFEMLGNFSFGDYFKREVIHWTWEFLTDVLGLDNERFCVTVFVDDSEAYDIWHNEIGLPDDRIHRLGEEKNYWLPNAISQGPNGPCGPCSEVFYRVAPLEEMTDDPALSPTEKYLVDDEAGRWLEVWNNVFTQFDRDEDANGKPILRPLPKKNNDTGAGLDRIACLVQGKTSVFETDIFEPTLKRVEQISAMKYGGTTGAQDIAFRVVAEHVRAAVFCIADGILPSNEGRGYVLRYIMRRAIRYGKKDLGFSQPFLHEVAPAIIEQMGEFYTELRERRELILKTILREEESFRRTLDNGINRLEEMLAFQQAKRAESPHDGSVVISPQSGYLQITGTRPTLSGDDVFMLYDTYGFPLKLTQEIAAERGFAIDMDGFERAMERQRRESKEGSRIESGAFRRGEGALPVLQRTLPASEFAGYESTIAEARILGLLSRDEALEIARAGDDVTVILDRTPFYAESGGQVGDTGQIAAATGDTSCALKIAVTDTQRTGGLILHTGKILEGEASVGHSVVAYVDTDRRRRIMRNHTATHLLQAALRQVVGGHVHQKGSLVDPDRLRFDFTHNQPVTAEELRRVEEIVNAEILTDEPVIVHADLPIAEAKARGAMALFGEKYGERVRMVEISDFSRELCGGTHLPRTSQVGLFKIVNETGVASGVRRIEAVTGQVAYRFVNQREDMLRSVASILKSNPSDVVSATEKLLQQRQELERQNRQLKAGLGAAQSVELQPQQVDGIAVVAHRIDGADGESIANLADRTALRMGSVIVVLGGVNDGKISLLAKVTPDLVQRGFHAGNLVRDVAKLTGGGGGGRADFAQAGGRNPEKLQEALDAVPRLVSAQLG